MNSIENLTHIFSKFPGIGPRQAKRFVYFLLTKNDFDLNNFISNLNTLKNDIGVCADCKRFFERRHKDTTLCDVCVDVSRDREVMMIVPRDIDMEAVEKNGVFKGMYFILGGIVPIMDKNPEKRVRTAEMFDLIAKKSKEGLKEIIIAMSWNPEGENTADFVKKQIENKFKIKISTLGKGLSMGAELEYTDPDTLRNALKNRN